MLDSIAPLDGMHGHVLSTDGNVPASRFLRLSGGGLMRFQLARIKAEMTRAAEAGQLYQLWWHPHNFGRETEERLRALEDILLHHHGLHDKFGFSSRSITRADA
jgi:3',5'-cyclic AMP phosphodiesterase CpdA